MFRCQICNRVAPAGATAHRIIIESRDKEYPSQQSTGPAPRPQRGGRKPKGASFAAAAPRDRGGKGHEISKELVVCHECAKQHTATV